MGHARHRTRTPSSGHHWLLIRRNDSTGEIAYYRCWHPRRVDLATLVYIAGRRWRIEKNFQATKEHVGLDQHQVRPWDSRYRWTTLAMAAHAFLTVIAHLADRDTPGLVPYTLAEVRRPLLTFWEQFPKPSTETIWNWSQLTSSQRRSNGPRRESSTSPIGHRNNASLNDADHQPPIDGRGRDLAT